MAPSAFSSSSSSSTQGWASSSSSSSSSSVYSASFSSPASSMPTALAPSAFSATVASPLAGYCVWPAEPGLSEEEMLDAGGKKPQERKRTKQQQHQKRRGSTDDSRLLEGCNCTIAVPAAQWKCTDKALREVWHSTKSIGMRSGAAPTCGQGVGKVKHKPQRQRCCQINSPARTRLGHFWGKSHEPPPSSWPEAINVKSDVGPRALSKTKTKTKTSPPPSSTELWVHQMPWHFTDFRCLTGPILCTAASSI